VLGNDDRVNGLATPQDLTRQASSGSGSAEAINASLIKQASCPLIFEFPDRPSTAEDDRNKISCRVVGCFHFLGTAMPGTRFLRDFMMENSIQGIYLEC
jgi:hypothetical protein